MNHKLHKIYSHVTWNIGTTLKQFSMTRSQSEIESTQILEATHRHLREQRSVASGGHTLLIQLP